MTIPLRQCKGCHRHVRDAECPFCGVVVAQPGRGAVTAAALAAAVAVGVAGAACGGGTPPQTPTQPAASDSDSPAVPTDSAAPSASAAPTPRAGAVYGGPPPQP
jgi:hypothetical protein